MNQKNLLKLMDWSQEEILETLDLADELKEKQKRGIPHELLKGKTLAMIFEKCSTRTRVSFEVGMYQLGGHAVFLSGSASQVGRGEPVKDTARVLSRMCDGIMVRTFAQKEADDLALYGTVPVINGLTDYCHPCQVLADLMTVREHKGKLAGLNLCYIGDGNNMANSLIVGGLKAGMNVSLACPSGHTPAPDVLAFAAEFGEHFHLCEDPMTAAVNADVIFTDVWASMGEEQEIEKRSGIFKEFCVSSELMAQAHPGCMVQHCLPAHRGEEITDEVLEAHADEIFDEAENRLHAQKAVLALLMA